MFWKRLQENKNNAQVVLARKGKNINIDAGENKVAALEFLAPLFDYSQYPIKDLNETSAILKMNCPHPILFMGDAGKKLEKSILSDVSHNIETDILKVGHHGSRFATSDEFLDVIKPTTALISVGEKNLFGHPAGETIKKLKDREIKIFRTDKDGRGEIKL